MSFPLVITAAGPQPTPPAVIQAALIALVASAVPGYTAILPGSMIEDISSTEVYGIAEIDSARVETINSLTTMGANAFLLLALGQLFIGPGSAPGVPTNTSVFVQFVVLDASTNPVPGYVIPVGFTVSDGTYQYVVQDGGVTDSGGTSPALFCLATIPGSWAIATDAVSQIVSSYDTTRFAISCFNPAPGIPGNPNAETEEAYRARVNQALQSVSTGTTAYLKTLLNQVAGVQARLISTLQQSGGGWEIIVGGGDPYLVAGAIFASGLDISVLVGSTLLITNISSANPGVVTTNLNHGYTTGETVTMSGIVGPPINGTPFVITVVDEKRFSIPVNTSLMAPYVSGGVCSPNPRNVTPNIVDPPNLYAIPFVSPPQQTVTIAVSWNTTLANFVSQASVSQLAAPAIIAYVNSILVGAPMSLLELSAAFVEAVASVLDPTTISALSFSVSINSIGTAPVGQLIFGDPESFFFAAPGSVTVTQA
jgi:hypothetical protein